MTKYIPTDIVEIQENPNSKPYRVVIDRVEVGPDHFAPTIHYYYTQLSGKYIGQIGKFLGGVLFTYDDDCTKLIERKPTAEAIYE